MDEGFQSCYTVALILCMRFSFIINISHKVKRICRFIYKEISRNIHGSKLTASVVGFLIESGLVSVPFDCLIQLKFISWKMYAVIHERAGRFSLTDTEDQARAFWYVLINVNEEFVMLDVPRKMSRHSLIGSQLCRWWRNWIGHS